MKMITILSISLFFSGILFAEPNVGPVLSNLHDPNQKRVSHEPIAKRIYDCREKMIGAGMEHDLREFDSDGSFYFVPPVRISQGEDPFFIVRKQGSKFSVLEGDRTQLNEKKRAVVTGPDGFRALAGSIAHRGENVTVLKTICEDQAEAIGRTGFPDEKKTGVPELKLKTTKISKPELTRIEQLGASYILGAIEHALGAATFGAEQGSKLWIDHLKKRSDKFSEALDFCHDRLASVEVIGPELGEKIDRYQQIMRGVASGSIKPVDPSAGPEDPSVGNPSKP